MENTAGTNKKYEECPYIERPLCDITMIIFRTIDKEY